MMRMVGTMVNIIVKNVDEEMIDNMPRYIFGQKRINKMREAFDSKVIVRSDLTSAKSSSDLTMTLKSKACLILFIRFLTKNITWHVIDHFLINIFDNNMIKYESVFTKKILTYHERWRAKKKQNNGKGTETFSIKYGFVFL